MEFSGTDDLADLPEVPIHLSEFARKMWKLNRIVRVRYNFEIGEWQSKITFRQEYIGALPKELRP